MRRSSEILRDVVSPRKRPCLIALVGLILIAAAWKTELGSPRKPNEPPDTIDYHYGQWKWHMEALQRAPSTNRFSLNTALALMEGNPTQSDRYLKIAEHETALLRLGYFAEFRFDTTNVGKHLAAFESNAMRTDLKYFWSASTVIYSDRTNVCITAPAEEIPKIEALVHQITNATPANR